MLSWVLLREGDRGLEAIVVIIVIVIHADDYSEFLVMWFIGKFVELELVHLEDIIVGDSSSDGDDAAFCCEQNLKLADRVSGSDFDEVGAVANVMGIVFVDDQTSASTGRDGPEVVVFRRMPV